MNEVPKRRDFKAEERANYFENASVVPESIEAEQQMLGSIMMNNAALDAIKIPIEPKHFFDPFHQKIFGAMRELREEGKRITPVSLKGYLSAYQKVGKLTVAEYLTMVAGEACSIVMASQHALDIMKASVARDAIAYAEQIRAASDHWGEQSFTDEIVKMTDELRARVEELTITENVRPGDAYMDRFNASSANDGAVGVAVGLRELRSVMNEDVFEAGNLYGLLSSSGEGKTSLTMQLIMHAINSGHPVQFLSYDQSQSQCVAQMIAQKFGIDSKQQKNPLGLMSQHEQDQSITFANWLNSQPIEIIRCHRETNKRLIAYASRFVAKHKGGKTPLIVIDHIKKIKARDDRLSPDKIASEITVDWKSFADGETKSSVLMLNQRNTEGTRRLNPRPISKDIYGGEGAKEDYDAIIYLYRPEKYRKDLLATCADEKERVKILTVFGEFGTEIETIAEIGVIKSRFGDPSMTQRLKFEGRYTRYVPVNPPEPQERMF